MTTTLTRADVRILNEIVETIHDGILAVCIDKHDREQARDESVEFIIQQLRNTLYSSLEY